jgi:hypothetical protein
LMLELTVVTIGGEAGSRAEPRIMA